MRNILVVDDDVDIHAFIENEFNDSCYKVFCAKGVDDAIVLLKERKFTCIFLDIILGENETSMSVLKYGHEIPIFLISAHITDEYKENILHKDSNIVDCIKKPFNKGQLFKMILDLESTNNITEEIKEMKSTAVALNTENETHVVKGEADLKKEVNVVSGIIEEDNKSLLVKGSGEENVNENAQKVEGHLEVDEHSTTIAGIKEDLAEENKLINGTKEDFTEENQMIAGTKEDLSEKSQLIAGTKEIIGEGSQVISGTADEVKDDTYIIKSEESVESKEHEDFDPKELSFEKEAKDTDSSSGKLNKEIAYLKKKGPHSRSLEGYTRLMISVLIGDKNEVELAIKDGERMEDKCKGGFTPLHLAVLKGNLDLVEYLLSKGAKITAKDNENREPLFFAIHKGHFEISKFLIEKGAPVNRRYKGKTYLVLATIKKNEKLFKLLLNKGIPFDARDDHGFNVNYYLKKFKIEHFLDKAA